MTSWGELADVLGIDGERFLIGQGLNPDTGEEVVTLPITALVAVARRAAEIGHGRATQGLTPWDPL